MMRLIRKLYDLLLRRRRLRRLTDILLPYLPENGRLLDCGCGNGRLASALKARRPGLEILGVDVLPAENADIPITVYDGARIPYPDNHFDYVLIVTVLHHTDDYAPLLTEVKRVARRGIILLDHQYGSRLEWLKLACIDWPGNVPFGVYTPLNFKTRREWVELFESLALREKQHDDRLLLFGKPADPILGRTMHFVSVLEKAA